MSVHILWVCGWLAWAGVASPYARAEQVQAIQHNIQVSTTISVGRELKDEYKALCVAKDEVTRSAIERYIEYLQNEYFQLTSQRYPEPRCP